MEESSAKPTQKSNKKSVITIASAIVVILMISLLWKMIGPGGQSEQNSDKSGKSKSAQDSSPPAQLDSIYPDKTTGSLTIATRGNTQYIETIKRPHGLNFDADGNFYSVDFTGRVMKFDQELNLIGYLTEDGWRETFASSKLFKQPHSIDFDSQGNIYVADYATQEIKKFDAEGKFLASIKGGLQGPSSVVLGPDGNLYVVDQLANQIVVFSTQGAQLRVISGDFDQPHQLRFDAEGNYYITDTGHHRVLKYNPQGGLVGALGATAAGPSQGWVEAETEMVASDEDGGLTGPIGIDFDEQNRIYVSEAVGESRKRVLVFSQEGEFLYQLGRYNAPYDIKIHGDYMFIAEPSLHHIKIVAI